VATEQPEDAGLPAAGRDRWQGTEAARRGDTPAAASRSEYVAERLARMAENRAPGERLGTKVALRELCEVSVGTFNEGVKLARRSLGVVPPQMPSCPVFSP